MKSIETHARAFLALIILPIDTLVYYRPKRMAFKWWIQVVCFELAWIYIFTKEWSNLGSKKNLCHFIIVQLFFTISGRQFDKHGNLKQWWNNKTIAEFRKAAQCIVDQYSNYTLDDINLAIDGRLTQGENIADNGGLKQAYRVSHKGLFECIPAKLGN